MNATAVPWPEMTRSVIPTATVASHATTPAGTTPNAGTGVAPWERSP